MKGLLIDLGGTVVYNRNVSFENGLKRIYDLAVDPKISFQQFLKNNKQLKAVTYDNREQFDINLRQYLNYLCVYSGLKHNLCIEDIELEAGLAWENFDLIEDVDKIFDFCKLHNIKIVALSNSTFSKRTLVKQMEDLNIVDYFDEILVSSEFMFRKPSSYFFDLGVRVLDCPKSEILYIGNDYYFDIIGGSSAGLKTCWFNQDKTPNTKNIDCLDVQNYQQLLKQLHELFTV